MTSPAEKLDLKACKQGRRETLFIKYPFKLFSKVSIMAESASFGVISGQAETEENHGERQNVSKNSESGVRTT